MEKKKKKKKEKKKKTQILSYPCKESTAHF